MTNPYDAPRISTPASGGLFRCGVVLLIIAAAMPILGLAGTVAGMLYSFRELSESAPADPDRLAEGISFSLSTTILGVVACVGVGFLGGLLILASRRGRSTAE